MSNEQQAVLKMHEVELQEAIALDETDDSDDVGMSNEDIIRQDQQFERAALGLPVAVHGEDDYEPFVEVMTPDVALWHREKALLRARERGFLS